VERESLLVTLIVLLGGLALQVFAYVPGQVSGQSPARRLEQRLWLALWWPAAAAVTVAVWLCGWALSQPDPVPTHVGWLLFVAVLPFAVIGLRALLRAVWSLRRSPPIRAIATVGVLRPRIVISPQLRRVLDARALHAAVAHERAHVRHRDPLRIWLAQLVTDLQWPSRGARRRFDTWLAGLERARDDEARAGGVDGADLAAAVLGAARLQLDAATAAATLVGRREDLPARITRLLQPLAAADVRQPRYLAIGGALGIVWLLALSAGLAWGEHLVDALLALIP
jgi:hypothetical protein